MCACLFMAIAYSFVPHVKRSLRVKSSAGPIPERNHPNWWFPLVCTQAVRRHGRVVDASNFFSSPRLDRLPVPRLSRLQLLSHHCGARPGSRVFDIRRR